MKISESWKFHGNIERIKELDRAGIGAHTIAGLFQDNNIEVNADDVRSLLKVIGPLSQKALPKSEAKKLIDQNNLDGLQPA